MMRCAGSIEMHFSFLMAKTIPVMHLSTLDSGAFCKARCLAILAATSVCMQGGSFYCDASAAR